MKDLNKQVDNFKEDPSKFMKYVLFAMGIVIFFYVFAKAIQILTGLLFFTMEIIALVFAVAVILYLANWINKNILNRKKVE